MKLFNFNKKTIWIFITLVLIVIIFHFVRLGTTVIGACMDCPPIEPSTLNKISNITMEVLYPISNYQHDISKGISYILGYRETDVSYDKYGDFSYTTGVIISLLIEALYLYILSCIINKIIDNIKFKNTN